jgi:predicted acylesterase/phospholipase RssA
MSTPKQAIVFSGGGAYGAYEVGVLKALAEDGWAGPEIVSGVSAGAINAAFLVGNHDGDMRRTAQHLEDVWVNRIPGHVFEVRGDPRPLLGFAAGPYAAAAARWLRDVQSLCANFGRRLVRLGPVGPFDERLLQLVDLASFISVDPLERLLREIIEPKKLRESSMRISIVATNWRNGKPEVFTNERMTDTDAVSILLASAAIPGFFPPREVGGSTYVDGGLLMNTPLKPAIADGAEEIHIVYLDPDIALIPTLKLQNTFDTLDRVLSINMAYHINADIETARQVNRAIELFEESPKDVPQLRSFELAGLASQWERVRSAQPPRKLAIHRYHPRSDLGGLLGLLRFEKNAIQDLIQRGYQDAVKHDCPANGCEVIVARPGKTAP